MSTADDNHAAEMRSVLLHRRSNRRQEKEMLLGASKRIADIDAELALIEADLARYGYEEPAPKLDP